MHAILRKLAGGDRRSIGCSAEVVAAVLDDPKLFGALLDGMSIADPIVRMRAADAIEKISALHPEYLSPYKSMLIEQAATSVQKEVRWHLAQMLPRLELSSKEQRQVVGVLRSYLSDSSSIVKTFAMQALADIAACSPGLRPSILVLLRRLTVTGTPAMRARGRKLLAKSARGKREAAE